jgi:hypothetical protein
MKKLLAVLGLSLALSSCSVLDELARIAEEQEQERKALEAEIAKQPLLVYQGYENGRAGIKIQANGADAFIHSVQSLDSSCPLKQDIVYGYRVKVGEDGPFLPVENGYCSVKQVSIFLEKYGSQYVNQQLTFQVLK